MNRSLIRFAALAALPLFLMSCAAGALVPERESMPAARAALLPEYRIFYDSLQDYGDWVLIEPYGYVFRPHVNFVAWQPYNDGFWAPTDVYGWTWISSEPFGWATYHYGNWAYDHFQGWVWVPGADWGPAWVAWNSNDNYIGWAPQLPRGATYSGIPGGGFSYIPVNAMGSANLTDKMVNASNAGADLAGMKPVVNATTVNGVRFNKGPALDWVERKAGPLSLVRIQDLVPPGDLAAVKAREEGRARGAGGVGKAGAAAGEFRHVTSPDSTRNAAETAASAARDRKERGFIGPTVPLVRPFGVDHRAATPGPGRNPRVKAAPDSTRER